MWLLFFASGHFLSFCYSVSGLASRPVINRPLIRLSIVIGIEAQIAHLWCLFWPPAACVLWLLALLFWLSFCSFTIHGSSSSVFLFCFHFFCLFVCFFVTRVLFLADSSALCCFRVILLVALVSLSVVIISCIGFVAIFLSIIVAGCLPFCVVVYLSVQRPSFVLTQIPREATKRQPWRQAPSWGLLRGCAVRSPDAHDTLGCCSAMQPGFP